MSAAESVLAAILLGGSKAYWRVADMLRADDFPSAKFASVYRVIGNVARSDADIDAITVGDQCEIEGVATAAEITRIASGSASPSNVRAYADRLKSDAMARRVRQIASKAVDDGDLSTLQASIASLLAASPAQAEHVSAPLKRMWDGVMARFESGAALSGIPTGFPKIDEMTGGLQPGRVYGIGARPKIGKTVLAMNIAANVSLAGRPVSVWSLEMSAEELTQRMCCALAGVPFQSLQNPGTAEESHWQKLTPALSALKSAPLHIADALDVTIEEVEAQARQIKATSGLDLLVLDYLGLFKLPKLDRHDLSLGHVTRRCKAIAKALQIPVILVFQLNRGSEQGQSVRPPRPSDARDSGSIEQDLDAMFLLHRPSYYDQSAERGLRLDLALQRNGPTGLIRLEDELHFCRFAPSQREWADTKPRYGADDL